MADSAATQPASIASSRRGERGPRDGHREEKSRWLQLFEPHLIFHQPGPHWRTQNRQRPSGAWKLFRSALISRPLLCFGPDTPRNYYKPVGCPVSCPKNSDRPKSPLSVQLAAWRHRQAQDPEHNLACFRRCSWHLRCASRFFSDRRKRLPSNPKTFAPDLEN